MLGVGWREGWQRGMRKLLRLMDMFNILMCVNYISTSKMNTMVEKGRVCGVRHIVAAILENTTYLIQQVFQPGVC